MAQSHAAQSLCLYSAHFSGANLPEYIINMLTEVNKYCSKILLITERKKLDSSSVTFLKRENIDHLQVRNKGMDFGKWYVGLNKINRDNWERILLVNDSMYLLKPLHDFFLWCNKDKASVKALLNSNERQAHLQSYFLVLEKDAILPTVKYFRKHKRFNKKRKIIRVYELGLSAHWQQLGFVLGSYIDINSIEMGFVRNPAYFLLETLIEHNIPMIKRHVLMDSFGQAEREALASEGFRLDKDYWLGKVKH